MLIEVISESWDWSDISFCNSLRVNRVYIIKYVLNQTSPHNLENILIYEYAKF